MRLSRLSLLFLFTLLSMLTYAQEVELSSEGIVFPNLSEAARDSLFPVSGQSIYNTTSNAFNIYNGTEWVELSSISADGSWQVDTNGIYYNEIDKHVAIGRPIDIDNKLVVKGGVRVTDTLRIGSPSLILFEERAGNASTNEYGSTLTLFEGQTTAGVASPLLEKISFQAMGDINTDHHPEFHMYDKNGLESFRLDYNQGAIYQAMYSDSSNLRLRFGAGDDADGPFIEQFNALNNPTIEMTSGGVDQAGEILLNSDQGNLRVQLKASGDDVGSLVRLYNNQNARTILLDGQGSGDASYVGMYSNVGSLRMGLYAGAEENGSRFELFNGEDVKTIHIDAHGSGTASFIELFDSLGNSVIKLDAERNGKSRITTDELEILGGSDFAEQFDLTGDGKPEAGMLVSIDPSQKGKLMISQKAYDQKIVGVISGANGISTGMLMSDKGSIADGDYPIALLGRVYVKADDSQGKIKAGDLLTSSSIPGHAMKAKRSKKSHGAVLGKAMSEIDETGFVLVLINLQ